MRRRGRVDRPDRSRDQATDRRLTRRPAHENKAIKHTDLYQRACEETIRWLDSPFETTVELPAVGRRVLARTTSAPVSNLRLTVPEVEFERERAE
ncbi:hypothetical protein CYV19_13240 [Natronobacterium gregoryi SP2]|uniref:Uncharacterized protein n=1 Tax=Natronobacterium gregoryi (strain ATCC 43098 / DSM 3393 / CCM 3738 / CIP 104747 / IAM 13177 / JCM 8860 / NBRC 102187 / NCIMB 2189 / SP2) TaxID=797304 RepID=L9YDF0_NATGS|nr:hypothetical protein C490_04092 [Natronobacterium gregoryi SP2]PLK19765.1 hypothetical protein CYV19_13240 [Natronobacterium gregoryi SP2]